MQLTHFVPRPPESEAWVQVAFFVSTDIPDSFLCGFDTKRPISAEDLNERVENGTTEKLLCRVDIDESKRVWISPACDIWVADAQYPLGDKNKQRAKKGAGPIGGYVVEESIAERIGARLDALAGRKRMVTLDKKYARGREYSNFVKCVVQNLCEAHGAMEMQRPEKPIRWDLIAPYLSEGSFDFCYDPYFLTKSRSESVQVVPFGRIEDLTVYVAHKTSLFETIVECNQKGSNLRDTLVQCHTNHPYLKIGVLGECAGTSEVNWLLRDALGVASAVTPMRDQIQMRVWIDENPEERLIVGDIGLVPMLEEVTEEDIVSEQLSVPPRFGEKSYAANDRFTKFKISQPCSVGFVYPLRDLRWESDIENAMRDALKELAATIRWDANLGGSITGELAKVGVIPLAFRELCQRFKAMDAYREYLKAEIERASRDERRFEDAAALKKELDVLASAQTGK